jgi:putative membrane protein
VRRPLLYHILVNALGLFILSEYLVKGIRFADTSALLIAAIVLGLANAVLRPILIILSLPINLLSLGLLTLVINGFMLSITAGLVRGLTIDAFSTAVWGAILLSIFRYLLERMQRPARS